MFCSRVEAASNFPWLAQMRRANCCSQNSLRIARDPAFNPNLPHVSLVLRITTIVSTCPVDFSCLFRSSPPIIAGQRTTTMGKHPEQKHGAAATQVVRPGLVAIEFDCQRSQQGRVPPSQQFPNINSCAPRSAWGAAATRLRAPPQDRDQTEGGRTPRLTRKPKLTMCWSDG